MIERILLRKPPAMKFFLLLSILIFSCEGAWAKEKPKQKNQIREFKATFDLTKDLKTTAKWLFQGSYKQFTAPSGLAFWIMGGLVTWPIFNSDRKIIDRQNGTSKFVKLIGNDISNAFNFPIVPVIGYYAAKWRGDPKLKQFAMEYMAALYLALGESAAMSFIQVQHRPDSSNLTPFETNFRGNSSFPSGHIIGPSILMYKSFQFYGPWAASIPAAFVFITHKERVGNRKHWASDTIFSIFMAGAASEGVRIAANYREHNHPFYKLIFEHDLSFNLINNDDKRGIMVGFSY